MDHVLKMMEKYAGNLEQTVADRTRQLTDEMKKSDLLLYRMLPRWFSVRTTVGGNIQCNSFYLFKNGGRSLESWSTS